MATLRKLTAAATLAAIAPSCIATLYRQIDGEGDFHIMPISYIRIENRQFSNNQNRNFNIQLCSARKHSFANLLCATSLSFFLVSYHVHEKSLLLPLAVLPLLGPAAGPLQALGLFSMFPLAAKDGAEPAYAALMLATGALNYRTEWKAVS